MNTAGEAWFRLTHVTACSPQPKTLNTEERLVSAITFLPIVHGHLEVRSTVSAVTAGLGETGQLGDSWGTAIVSLAPSLAPGLEGGQEGALLITREAATAMPA